MKQMIKTVYQTGNASTYIKCAMISSNSNPKRKEKYVWGGEEEICDECK